MSKSLVIKKRRWATFGTGGTLPGKLLMTEKEFLENLTILIDSREQAAYSFPGYKSVIRGLPIGDYSLLHCENEISIERKSIDDLMGSLTKGRERFEKELKKGEYLRYFALVIEASLTGIVNGRYTSEMIPKSAVQSLLAWSVKYRLPIFFCESREYAERITLSLLLKYGRMVYQKYSLLAKKT